MAWEAAENSKIGTSHIQGMQPMKSQHKWLDLQAFSTSHGRPIQMEFAVTVD